MESGEDRGDEMRKGGKQREEEKRKYIKQYKVI
jgi:hypothetical protein